MKVLNERVKIITFTKRKRKKKVIEKSDIGCIIVRGIDKTGDIGWSSK